MKKSEVKVSVEIGSAVSDVWDVIGAVTGVENWFAPMITGSRMEGDKRVCSTESGEFEEDIFEVNHDTRTFRYGIPKQHMMPVENILGTMHVRKGATGGSIVDWHWTFDVEPENEQQAREMLSQAGSMGINGIDALIKKQAAV